MGLPSNHGTTPPAAPTNTSNAYRMMMGPYGVTGKWWLQLIMQQHRPKNVAEICGCTMTLHSSAPQTTPNSQCNSSSWSRETSNNQSEGWGGVELAAAANEAYLPPHTASEAETTRHSSRLRHPEAMAVAPKAMDLLHRHPHCLPASWCGKFDGCYHSALSHRICRRWADAVERSSSATAPTAQLNRRKNKQQSTGEFLESRALVLVLWEPWLTGVGEAMPRKCWLGHQTTLRLLIPADQPTDKHIIE